MHGAFLQEGFGQSLETNLAPSQPMHGRLDACKLAVKDVFDVRGLTTGAGNPAWRAAQPVADRPATAVRLLLDSGAQWLGKTVTDELTYSLAGINVHYGTPINPRDPQRLPGGSSSGSVVAVSGGYADIGLGTDCGGSVRLPASYCGVWGMRPSHGRISGTGCIALAPSFDTVGWFARDGRILADVLETLAHTEVRPLASPLSLAVSADIEGLLDEPVRLAFQAAQDRLGAHFNLATLPAGTLRPQSWAPAFRTLQAAEVHQQFGPWCDQHADSFGPDVRMRFLSAARISSAEVHDAQKHRVDACVALNQRLVTPCSFLLLPTVPMVAPKLSDDAAQVDDIRGRSQQLLCLAGLAGLPQVSMPWAEIAGAPVGLSLIGGRGQDEQVAQAALDVYAALHTRPIS